MDKDKIWEIFLEGVNGFTDDYFEILENRVELPSERVSFDADDTSELNLKTGLNS